MKEQCGPRGDKGEAAHAINQALIAGWDGMPIAERLSLDEIATAHERLEAPRQRGRVVVLLSDGFFVQVPFR